MADMTIDEFVLARLAEAEADALRWKEAERTWQFVGDRNLRYDNGAWENVAAIDVSNQPCLWWERIWVKGDSDGSLTAHLVRHDPDSVLADVQAKRALLTGLLSIEEKERRELSTSPNQWALEELADMVRRQLAAPYAGHADYKPEWKVE